MASEGLPAALGEHVMRPALIPYSPAAHRRTDAGEAAEIFHPVTAQGTRRFRRRETTESKKAQGRRQTVEHAGVVILVGIQTGPWALIVLERYAEASAHEADSMMGHQSLGVGGDLMSLKGLGSLSRFGNVFAAMSETGTSLKFSVEGEQGLEVDERDREGAGGSRGGGRGEGNATAVHGGVQAQDPARGGRL